MVEFRYGTIDMSGAKFQGLPSRSQGNLDANSFPCHNFVVYGGI